jgi:hypothetical protein
LCRGVERQLEPLPRRRDESHDLGHDWIERRIIVDDARLREALREVATQDRAIVAEENGANAPVGRRDQDGAKPAFTDGGADQATRVVEIGRIPVAVDH